MVMGITGLLPFLEKASRKANVSEFTGCTVAIDSYCWLHKGAFACAEKLVRGEETDIHIKYCLKYVTMLLSRNIKPILVFDGRHLPAKAMTEAKRRESRNISKKRAAELLSLGQTDEARSFMRRSVDITHAMALCLIKECRKRNIDCIVAPYEADAQLAYLNMKNIAQLVVTEDSDLVLFGCTKVLFKMDLDGNGTLVETAKLPLVMKCPVDHYNFNKFRQMCILSGCDYLASLPGIGLAKARQFVNVTQDPNFANAIKKLPSFFNRSNLIVTDEYCENFLKAEATFKHQYAYDPITREMVRLTDPEDEGTEIELCCNAGENLDPEVAFQIALGNLDPFTLKKMDDWNPDKTISNSNTISYSWKTNDISTHPTIWSADFKRYLNELVPWQKKILPKKEAITFPNTRPVKKIVNLVSKYVAETQDESLSIENLSSMYCIQSVNKEVKQSQPNDRSFHNKTNTHNIALAEDDILKELTDSQESYTKSPILENKRKSYRKSPNCTFSVLKSKIRRTILDDSVVESKFFNSFSDSNITENATESTILSETDLLMSTSQKENSVDADHNEKDKSPILNNTPKRNPFKCKSETETVRSLYDEKINENNALNIIEDGNGKPSPDRRMNPFKMIYQPESIQDTDISLSDNSFVENTYPMETTIPLDSLNSFSSTQPDIKSSNNWKSNADGPKSLPNSQPGRIRNSFRSKCRVPGLKKNISISLEKQRPLSDFGFQKRPVMKK